MGEKLSRSWSLTKQAWGVLKDDKRLLIFPLISGTLVVALVSSTVVGVILALMGAENAGGAAKVDKDQFFDQYGPFVYVGLFLLYLVVYFIITFFQAALLSCALTKLNGQQPTIGGGFKAAVARLPQIFAWALVNATVGMLLQMIQERVGWIARIFFGMASIAWNIAAFFVVPVLVVEGIGPIQALKRSAGVVKKTWGESLITQFGFSAVSSLVGLGVFLLLAIAGIGLSIVLDSGIPAAVLLPLAILSVLILAIVQSAMKTVLIAATYRFATTGDAGSAFDPETLRGVFRTKTKRK